MLEKSLCTCSHVKVMFVPQNVQNKHQSFDVVDLSRCVFFGERLNTKEKSLRRSFYTKCMQSNAPSDLVFFSDL